MATPESPYAPSQLQGNTESVPLDFKSIDKMSDNKEMDEYDLKALHKKYGYKELIPLLPIDNNVSLTSKIKQCATKYKYHSIPLIFLCIFIIIGMYHYQFNPYHDIMEVVMNRKLHMKDIKDKPSTLPKPCLGLAPITDVNTLSDFFTVSQDINLRGKENMKYSVKLRGKENKVIPIDLNTKNMYQTIYAFDKNLKLLHRVMNTPNVQGVGFGVILLQKEHRFALGKQKILEPQKQLIAFKKKLVKKGEKIKESYYWEPKGLQQWTERYIKNIDQIQNIEVAVDQSGVLGIVMGANINNEYYSHFISFGNIKDKTARDLEYRLYEDFGDEITFKEVYLMRKDNNILIYHDYNDENNRQYNYNTQYQEIEIVQMHLNDFINWNENKDNQAVSFGFGNIRYLKYSGVMIHTKDNKKIPSGAWYVTDRNNKIVDINDRIINHPPNEKTVIAIYTVNGEMYFCVNLDGTLGVPDFLKTGLKIEEYFPKKKKIFLTYNLGYVFHNNDYTTLPVVQRMKKESQYFIRLHGLKIPTPKLAIEDGGHKVTGMKRYNTHGDLTIKRYKTDIDGDLVI